MEKNKKRKQSISTNNRINNLTSAEEFTRLIRRNTLEVSYLSKYYPTFEVIIWKLKFKPVSKQGINPKLENIL